MQRKDCCRRGVLGKNKIKNKINMLRVLYFGYQRVYIIHNIFEEVYSTCMYLAQHFTIENWTCYCPLVDKLCTLALVYCNLLVRNGNAELFGKKWYWLIQPQTLNRKSSLDKSWMNGWLIWPKYFDNIIVCWLKFEAKVWLYSEAISKVVHIGSFRGL